MYIFAIDKLYVYIKIYQQNIKNLLYIFIYDNYKLNNN